MLIFVTPLGNGFEKQYAVLCLVTQNKTRCEYTRKEEVQLHNCFVLCSSAIVCLFVKGMCRKLLWKQSEIILMLFQEHHQFKIIIIPSYYNKKLRKCPYILLAFACLLSNHASSAMLEERTDEKVNVNPYNCCQQILILERRVIHFDKTLKFTKKLRQP